ncbi:hypothetical protein HPP92_001699 [Vanilla planifolia]|uniref:type I protein arginine methyltransferase n=1 Tax=Vanilla planifolia TaxID=51239 RepID=A0A835RUG6_VANPL|nr:hypothetical protein HPP92_001699 [Vanilla planifolia]
MSTERVKADQIEDDEEEEDLEEEEGLAEGWDDWQSDDSSLDYLCLFCMQRYECIESLFEHCNSMHYFDFRSIVKDLQLDFYGSLKLINFVRSQVASIKCWACGLTFECIAELQNHLHAAVNIKICGNFPWDDDLYLKPFMNDDALLHSFAGDEEEEHFDGLVTKEDIHCEVVNVEDINEIYNCNQRILEADKPYHINDHLIKGDVVDEFHASNHFERNKSNSIYGKVENRGLHQKKKDELKVSFANVAAKEIKNVNENYFGSYGSFCIHKEMISDKVRTETYKLAIMNNPSLIKRSTVMDVGCGTGILSLFAAQSGASRVIAIEASMRMATMATQIAKDNGLLYEENNNAEKHISGVIEVVEAMVEDLDKFKKITPQSVDVLVSEWMGYCLLYESMLSSVLHARDYWLKPGGAILPDTATIFVAGFGRGGTSLPFWENVYGFNMSCIGKEVMNDIARSAIVDVINGEDIVTESSVLQTFDLATMKPDEVDFTSTCELIPKSTIGEGSTGICWCYGIVLWFETGFTSRFCKEMPVLLSTSPYSPHTHWSQTIFTFQEPIAMTCAKAATGHSGLVGTEQRPAASISSRISIARSSVHRSIDISIEVTGISVDGKKRSWPVQIFDL